MLGDFVAWSSSYHFIVMTQSEPKMSTYILKLCYSMNTTYISHASLIPRHFLPSVLQATAGGGEDLGMSYVRCKRYETLVHHETPSCSLHNALQSNTTCTFLVDSGKYILGYTAHCCYETWVGSTISSLRSIPIFIASCHGASWYKAPQLGGRCNLIPGTSSMTTLLLQQTVAMIYEFSYPAGNCHMAFPEHSAFQHAFLQ